MRSICYLSFPHHYHVVAVAVGVNGFGNTIVNMECLGFLRNVAIPWTNAQTLYIVAFPPFFFFTALLFLLCFRGSSPSRRGHVVTPKILLDSCTFPRRLCKAALVELTNRALRFARARHAVARNPDQLCG